MFYKPTHCTRTGINTKGRQTYTLYNRIDTNVWQTDLDQQARHLLVIFENLEVTLKTETTFSNYLSGSYILLLSVRCARKWKLGIVYNNTGIYWSAFGLCHWWQRNFEDWHEYRLIRASCITMAYRSLWGNI